MKVDIVAPLEFQGELFLCSLPRWTLLIPIPAGSVIGGINQRKGAIVDTEIRDEEFTLTAEVSLNDMFGYASTLRGITQGKGEFTMEYLRHSAVLPFVQKEMMEAYRTFAVKK